MGQEHTTLAGGGGGGPLQHTEPVQRTQSKAKQRLTTSPQRAKDDGREEQPLGTAKGQRQTHEAASWGQGSWQDRSRAPAGAQRAFPVFPKGQDLLHLHPSLQLTNLLLTPQGDPTSTSPQPPCKSPLGASSHPRCWASLPVLGSRAQSLHPSPPQ